MTAVHPRVNNLAFYRVIYGDTDQMGVVYYANYLRWFEKGRSEFLRQIGLPYKSIEERGLHFPVTEVSCRYFKSAHYDDNLVIETRMAAVGRATLQFEYDIFRQDDRSCLATGWTKHACLDGAGRVVRIPGELARLMAS